MGRIEEFASLTGAEILELAKVQDYYRMINGVRTKVKGGEHFGRDGGAKTAGSGKGKQPEGPSVDMILSTKVPITLTPLQRYELKSRAGALRKILTNRVALEKSKSRQIHLAIDVIKARADYYDSLNDPSKGYNDREEARLALAQKLLDLKGTMGKQQMQQMQADSDGNKDPNALINENNARATTPKGQSAEKTPDKLLKAPAATPLQGVPAAGSGTVAPAGGTPGGSAAIKAHATARARKKPGLLGTPPSPVLPPTP